MLGLGVAACALMAVTLTARFVAAPPTPGPATTVRVEADGDLWWFTRCAFVGSDNQIIEHTVVGEGGEEIILKVPGALRYLDLECSRAVTGDLSLYEWRKQVEDGEIQAARRDLTVVLFDAGGSEITRWIALDTWPASVQYDLSDQPTETVLIAVESIVRDTSTAATPTSPPPTSPPSTPTPTPATPTPTPTLPTLTPTPPIPTPTPPPECVVTVQGRTVDGSETYESCGVLFAGPALDVVSPGDLGLRAGDLVVLRNGVSVGSGARLTLEIDPTIPPP